MRVFRNSIWIDGTLVGVSTSDRNGGLTPRRARGGNAASYEQRVHRTLETIAANPAGNILLRSLALDPRHKIKIVRYGNDLGTQNAWAGGYDANAATSEGEPVRGQPAFVDRLAYPFGRGGGTDVYVAFSPGTWTHAQGAANRPDQVLHHELTHALRNVRGHLLLLRVDGDYPNQEEFLATLTTNIYISANGRGEQLLGSYSRNQGIPDGVGANTPSGNGGPMITQSSAFMRRYRDQIERLYDDERSYLSQLARLECNFNPIRDYVRENPARSLFQRHWE